MAWFKRFARSQSRVGIELAVDHINIVVRDAVSGSITRAASLFMDGASGSSKNATELIESFASDNDLKNAECNLVLPSKDYQMLLVERPEVPDSELGEAVKWKVKDLIQAPIESVVLDTFELPNSASKGKDMIYVVVADRRLLSEQIESVREGGLKLKAIDIDVLSLRNLLVLKNLERSAAVVRLADGQGDVSIFQGHDLYLSRHFNLNYGGGLLDDVPAADLALELQRSFDYFERQMGQTPPSAVFICGEGIGPEKVTEELQRSIAAKVEYLDVRQDVSLLSQLEGNTDEGILQLCVAAIGATFRSEAA